jgi:thiamine-phosphate pyrophosphorylase
LIQLREKNGAAGEFYREALESVEVAHAKGVKIIINDRIDIAIATGADGVHLGQDDLPPERARDLLGERAIIGFSTHSVQEAVEALRLPIDYIAIGPVFSTSTKPDHETVVGLEIVRAVRQAIGDFPLVAIGGITDETVASVLDAGADAVAVISSVLSDPMNITETMQRLTEMSAIR